MPNLKLKVISLVFTLLALSALLLWRVVDGNKTKVDLIVKDTKIFTMNSTGEIINDGWLVIDNGTIRAIESEKCCGNYQANEVIDAQGKTIMPGLINTHSHVGMSSLRNIDNSHKLQEWLINTGEIEKNFTEEDVYNNSKMGIEEMLRNGITTFNDMYFFPEQTIKAAKEFGIRAMVRIPTLRNETGNLKIDQLFYEKYKHDSLVNFNLAPNPLTEYSLDELRWFSGKAKELNIPIHIHLAEDPSADQEILQKFNLSPLELLKQSGLISNKLIIAHAITFSETEIQELAQYPNVSISFNPKSNYLLSDTTAPIDKFLENDITAGVGTDGTASSGGTLDVLDQIKFASLISRCNSILEFCIDQRQISPYTWIKMATIDGAEALGLGKVIGSIEIEKQADIIILDTKNYDNLVYGSSIKITDVIVDGKVVIHNKN